MFLRMNICLILLFHFIVVRSDDDKPQIQQEWIYAMLLFAFIGSIVIILIIIISIYKTNQIIASKQNISKVLLTINFIIWTCNCFACIEWLFLRTNLFITLNKQKCVIIYISNYLFYMFAKYCLHILLLYRLHIVFKQTAYPINIRLIKWIIMIATVNFIIFTGLWLDICIKNVSVGVAVPSETLTICTLYNNDSNSKYSIYTKIWPFLFGAQDLIIGVITLVLFTKKIRDLSHATGSSHDEQTALLLRKLCILGTFAICSTFVFFTFAVPFYGNLTFLLPFDATLNSLCTILLLEYSRSIYLKLCCPMDYCLKIILKHKKKNIEEPIANIIQKNEPETTEGTNNYTVNTEDTKYTDTECNVQISNHIIITDENNKMSINSSSPKEEKIRRNNRLEIRNRSLNDLQSVYDQTTLSMPALHINDGQKPLCLADSIYSSSAFL